MRVFLLQAVLVLSSFFAFAHSPDVSTAFLAEQENGAWVVQLNTALTAFEYEVHYHYSDTSYTTPDEFKDLVAKHCREHFTIIANGTDTLSYVQVAVRLGHATDVILQVKDMPSSISQLQITNAIFKDLKRSKSTLVILKKGLPKAQAPLTRKNGFSQTFNVGDELIEIAKPSIMAGISPWAWAALGGSLVLVGLDSFLWK